MGNFSGKKLLDNIDRLVFRFSKRKLWLRFLIIMVIAIVVRTIYWLLAPVANAGDSHMFLDVAKSIYLGEITEELQFPFHIVYSLFLAPGYIFPNGLLWYIPLLHILLSAIVVLLLYLISREITDNYYIHFLTVIAAIFYPHLLFWMKFILSEVVYIPILLTFTYVTILIVKKPSLMKLATWILFALLSLFTRPVSLLMIFVSAVIVLGVFLRSKFPKKWTLFTASLVSVGLILGVIIVSIPTVNQKLLRLPTVYLSLWLSTRMVSGTFEDYYVKAALPPEVVSLSGEEQREYRVNYALDFIRTKPLQYGTMVIRRFFNYYYPWNYPQWSLKHRVFDAILTISMTVTILVSHKIPTKNNITLILLAFVLAFGVTSAFSQIDTDGRYRLPAEVLAIPVSSAGAIKIIEKLFKP